MHKKTALELLKNNKLKIDGKSHVFNKIEHQFEEEWGPQNVESQRIYCFNCDKHLPLTVEGDTITFKEECIAKPLKDVGKLEATITVKTGELVFQNFFRTDNLHHDPDNEWGPPSINSLIGRKKLMDYLATQNVGYGQMGNMSIGVYSNMKDEIIISSAYLSEERGEKAKQLKKYFKENNFRKLGNISLSMWRWQCADKSVLEEHNEVIREDAVIINVESGEWQIEHFFDFAYESDVIFSRLKLKEPEEEGLYCANCDKHTMYEKGVVYECDECGNWCYSSS